MSSTLLALMIGAVTIVVVLLTRNLRRDPGGHRRRFDDTPNRPHDEAFPYASTLYIGDGGRASHSHHQHSADCPDGGSSN